MAKTKQRRAPVRMDKFKRQFSEEVIGEGSLVPVEIGDGDVVKIKLPLLLDEDDDYQDRLQQATQSDEEDAVPLVVLGANPDRDAEEQWAAWQAAGYTSKDLAAIYQAELLAAQDRLRDFRYGG
ncbi:hypothetical protein ACX12M_17130 [Cellulosimicrobium cellulans]|uniref:hypothetical protein n=1 Tax=Cellulosimicrobium funkei TaxID=264251 RepID=UPI003654BC10